MAIDFQKIREKFPAVQIDEGKSILIVDKTEALALARWLKEEPSLRMDYASNVTGVDYLEREVQEKKKGEDGKDLLLKRIEPAYMEVVYHLYSMEKKHGPLVLRQRTGRVDSSVTSLTPVYRGAELQEREVFDLFGIRFDGHPDLRRILMWDGYKDYPMRRDYQEPDDYEYEPTPHDEILEKAKVHYPKRAETATGGAAA